MAFIDLITKDECPGTLYTPGRLFRYIFKYFIDWVLKTNSEKGRQGLNYENQLDFLFLERSLLL